MTVVVETPRLLLREFSMEDAPDIFRINSDPEVVRYAEGVTPASLEETRGHLRDGPLADYARFGYGRWAVVERATDRLIGMCGPKLLPGLNEVEIGYRLERDRWGLGLATEAALATREYARDVLALTHVIALIMEDNVRSLRVADKLGMTCTGPIEFDAVVVLRYEVAFER